MNRAQNMGNSKQIPSLPILPLPVALSLSPSELLTWREKNREKWLQILLDLKWQIYPTAGLFACVWVFVNWCVHVRKQQRLNWLSFSPLTRKKKENAKTESIGKLLEFFPCLFLPVHSKYAVESKFDASSWKNRIANQAANQNFRTQSACDLLSACRHLMSQSLFPVWWWRESGRVMRWDESGQHDTLVTKVLTSRPFFLDFRIDFHDLMLSDVVMRIYWLTFPSAHNSNVTH